MLLEFFGAECPHCVRMKPLIERLKTEEHAVIESYEVWHNKENAEKMMEYAKGRCGGVPFFYNMKSGSFICGEAEYPDLKRWANGENMPQV